MNNYFILHTKNANRSHKYNRCVTNRQWRIQDFQHEGGGGRRQPIILAILSQDCMQLKEIRPREGCAPLAPSWIRQ